MHFLFSNDIFVWAITRTTAIVANIVTPYNSLQEHSLFIYSEVLTNRICVNDRAHQKLSLFIEYKVLCICTTFQNGIHSVPIKQVLWSILSLYMSNT